MAEDSCFSNETLYHLTIFWLHVLSIISLPVVSINPPALPAEKNRLFSSSHPQMIPVPEIGVYMKKTFAALTPT